MKQALSKKHVDAVTDQGHSKAHVWSMAQFGVQMASMVIVGFALGYVCDRVLPTEPYGMIFFFIMGIAAAARQMIREIKKQMKQVHDEQ